jgi:hypothetical protein
LGWRAAFSFVPDLSLTVLIIGGLAVLTGVVRSARMYRARTQSTDATDSGSTIVSGSTPSVIRPTETVLVTERPLTPAR